MASEREKIVDSTALTRGFSDLHLPTWIFLIAFLGTLRTILLHPLQLAISRCRTANVSLSVRKFHSSILYYLMEACQGTSSSFLIRTSLSHGLRRLYRGFGVVLVGSILGQVSYCFLFEKSRYLLCTLSDHMNMIQTPSILSIPQGNVILAGMISEISVALLFTPFSVVSSRQMTAGYGMTSNMVYQSAFRTLQAAWRTYTVNESHRSHSMLTTSSVPHRFGFPSSRRVTNIMNGFRGVYGGFSTVFFSVPLAGLWWWIYVQTKEILYVQKSPSSLVSSVKSSSNSNSFDAPSQSEPPPLCENLRGDINSFSNLPYVSQALQSFFYSNWLFSPTDDPILNGFAGCVASAIVTIMMNPISVVRIRLQTASMNHLYPKGYHPKSRLCWTFYQILRREGLLAFFKGMLPNIVINIADGFLFSELFEITKLVSDKRYIQSKEGNSS